MTPIARVPRLRIATTSAPVRTWTPRPAAACSNALASAPVPPVANTAVPAAPPSVPAESLRKTCAVPVAHGPIAVLRIPRVASGPRMASSANTSWTRSATDIGSARTASRPVLPPRSRNALPSFNPMIASASDGDFGSGGVATAMYARKLAIARTFLSKSR